MSISYFDDDEAGTSERRLWIAVVDLAVKDALAFGRAYQDSAIRWLFRDSDDRSIVFDLAGIDPDWFTKGVAAAIIDQAKETAVRPKASDAERSAASDFLLSLLCAKLALHAKDFRGEVESLRVWRNELLSPRAKVAASKVTAARYQGGPVFAVTDIHPFRAAQMRHTDPEYPYLSVSEALRFGYGAECRLIYQRDSTFARYQGGSVRLPEGEYSVGMTAYERAGDPGKVVGVVRKVLSGHVLAAVEARYLPFETSMPEVMDRKHYVCAALIPDIRRDLGKNVDGEFLAAVISDWAGLMAWHLSAENEYPPRWKAIKFNKEFWSSRLKVHPRTVWRRRSEIEAKLNDYLDTARVRLGNPMRDCGLIP